MPLRRKTGVLLWSLLALGVIGTALVVWLLTVPAPIERWLQARVLLALREHYQQEVQLQNLRITLIPTFYATADAFVLPNRAGADLPPLITAEHMAVRANLLGLLRTPIHVTWLRLDGLKVQVAHRRDNSVPTPSRPKQHTHLANFVIDRVDADATELYVLRRDPGKEPMEWDIRRLRLRSAGVGQPMRFQAELTNPTPPGVIQTSGRFGPWNFDEPSATQVAGHYDFQHADLSVFNGISGMLSSNGDYDGTLEHIAVNGNTDIPDFQLDRGGQPVHLTTQFHAIVDGTNGNTYLPEVRGHFLNSDVNVSNGKVAGKPGQTGKTIAMDVNLANARVEDMLALASQQRPPMLTGRLQLLAALLLPPGKEAVLQKMTLDGKFQVSDARFTHEKIKKVLAELSRRGQGKPDDTAIADVAADFSGDFRLHDAALTFKKIGFLVPGVSAQMKGSYGLHDEQIDFTGDVKLEARLSQTMKGAKRTLLVPLDPLFIRHGAGTYLPVTITGTRNDPHVKLQLKKIF